MRLSSVLIMTTTLIHLTTGHPQATTTTAAPGPGANDKEGTAKGEMPPGSGGGGGTGSSNATGTGTGNDSSTTPPEPLISDQGLQTALPVRRIPSQKQWFTDWLPFVSNVSLPPLKRQHYLDSVTVLMNHTCHIAGASTTDLTLDTVLDEGVSIDNVGTWAKCIIF